MTYDQWFDTSLLFDIKCFESLGYHQNYNNEYIFAFNDLNTSGVIVQQPRLSSREESSTEEDEEVKIDSSIGSVDYNLIRKYNI